MRPATPISGYQNATRRTLSLWARTKLARRPANASRSPAWISSGLVKLSGCRVVILNAMVSGWGPTADTGNAYCRIVFMLKKPLRTLPEPPTRIPFTKIW